MGRFIEREVPDEPEDAPAPTGDSEPPDHDDEPLDAPADDYFDDRDAEFYDNHRSDR